VWLSGRELQRPGRAAAACGAISTSEALLGKIEALTDSFLEISPEFTSTLLSPALLHRDLDLAALRR